MTDSGALMAEIIEKNNERLRHTQSVIVVEPNPAPRWNTMPERYKPVAQDRYGYLEAHVAKLVLMVEDGLVMVIKSTLWDDVFPGDSWELR